MKLKKQIKKIDSIFSKKIRSKKKYKFHIKQLKKDIKTVKKTYEKGEIRDGHIGTAIGTVVENILIWVILSNKLPLNCCKFIRNLTCNCIATAVETPEGKKKLAQAMSEPIRRASDYEAVGRKLIMIDELPEGAHASYDKALKEAAKAIKENKCKK